MKESMSTIWMVRRERKSYRNCTKRKEKKRGKKFVNSLLAWLGDGMEEGYNFKLMVKYKVGKWL